jgi:hypothetical protein
VRKRTAADDFLMSKLTNVLSEGPPVKMVDIDCNNKQEILQSVFEKDQGMRKAGQSIDPAIDHENLEIIVSFLEKCGIPTLDEVNDVQMAAIWAVLQHSNNKYRKMYLPLLEKAADNGDMKWSTIALIKDRVLMDDGLPQVYGTQILNGELWTLTEPEYVDKRRAEVGLGPLKDYLKRFNVTFDVEQKQ